MSAVFNGRVWHFGDNVDTDVIISSRYMTIVPDEELGKYAFEDIRPDFGANVKPGDVVVGGSNFGCGSSREHAPLAIRNSGISCIIAESYSRIFFRNAVNMGFRVCELPNASRLIDEGDELVVYFDDGKIFNKTKNETYEVTPLPDFMKQIYGMGGMEGYIKSKMK